MFFESCVVLIILASLEDFEEAVIEKNLQKDTAWLEIESIRESHHWLPWQPDISQGQKEEDCEDPDRLVVFDDVKPPLFNISRKFHLHLVMAFLEFLGFRSDKLDPSLFAQFLESLDDDSKLLSRKVFSLGANDVDNEIVRNLADNLLQQVSPCFIGSEKTLLTLYSIENQLLHFKNKENVSKTDKKEVRKILKNVLKEDCNRNNLQIWCAYIGLERLIGKPDEARTITETALSMYAGKQIEDINEEVNSLMCLYGLYCEILLNLSQVKPKCLLPKTCPVSADVHQAVPVVLQFMLEGKVFCLKEVISAKVTGASVLKIAAIFTKQIDELISLMKDKTAFTLKAEKFLNTVWCYALFSYCASGIEASIKIYTNMLDKTEKLFQQDKDVEKHLHTQKLRLIVHHMSISPSPLSILRTHLDLALDKYPQDLVFLQLFVDIEKKSRVTGNLNRFFDKLCRVEDSPGPTLVAVANQCEFIAALKTEGKVLTVYINVKLDYIIVILDIISLNY